MRAFWPALLISTAVIAALITGWLRRYAQRSGLIDHPNARSSHSVPTPRGGGLAIVIASLAATGVLYGLELLPGRIFAALLGGGLAVAAVGYVDDRHTLRAGVRFLVHVAAALWCLACLGGLPPLQIGAQVVHSGWVGYLLGSLAIVWVLNLFNFMDGIDGIAASEAVFVMGAGAVLITLVIPVGGLSAAAAAGAAACAGFLVWNWPPAKIFMGDVGSGYLGYLIAVFAVAAGHGSPAGVWIWLILGGVFFVDATVTLVRRTLRGDKPSEAHRTHAYQRLSRRWGAHRPVTLATLAINIFWLLPAAWLAARYPSLSDWILLGALTPLAVLIVASGAGLPDTSAAGARNG